MDSKYSGIRSNYERHSLLRQDLETSPFLQLQLWLEDAVNHEYAEPTAMSLATVDCTGKPTQRIVLLKDISDQGITFFTNYLSSKGIQMANNPGVSALFFWPQLERQVRWEGRVQKLSEEKSSNYFATRPRESQLGAWASPQSEKIGGDQLLLQRFNEFQEKFKDTEVPRPPHWGGYVIIPHKVEFWQGRPGRMHQRFVYSLQSDNSWDICQLAP